MSYLGKYGTVEDSDSGGEEVLLEKLSSPTTLDAVTNLNFYHPDPPARTHGIRYGNKLFGI